MSAAPSPFFYEESLVVLKPVRGSHHGVIQAVRVEKFERLPDPLLEVGGGDNLEVGGDGKSLLHPFALGVLDHYFEKVDPVRLEKVLGEESRSGRTRANTFPFPMARVARAAQTELSMPPETAMTHPLRKRVAETMARIC